MHRTAGARRERAAPDPSSFITSTVTVMLIALLSANGCSKSSSSTNEVEAGAVALKPEKAATQLQTAFTSAPAEVKTLTETASQALRSGDYEKAIVHLHTVKTRGNLTFEQGMAVHNSMVALESKLVAGVTAGDPQAKRAFELLKAAKKD